MNRLSKQDVINCQNEWSHLATEKNTKTMKSDTIFLLLVFKPQNFLDDHNTLMFTVFNLFNVSLIEHHLFNTAMTHEKNIHGTEIQSTKNTILKKYDGRFKHISSRRSKKLNTHRVFTSWWPLALHLKHVYVCCECVNVSERGEIETDLQGESTITGLTCTRRRLPILARKPCA